MLKSIFVGYLSRLLSVGGSILVLPLVLGSLSNFEFNMWIVFSTAFMFQSVLDFGFSPTISRFYGYARANKNETDTVGSWLDKLTPELIYKGARSVYFLLGLMALILSIAFYFFYIKNLQDGETVILEWSFMALALIIHILFLNVNTLLHGYERVIDVHFSSVYSSLAFLILAYVFSLYGFGLLGLTMARFLSVFVNRLYCFYRLYREPIELKIDCKLRNGEWVLLKKIGKQSVQVGFGALGGYLSNRSLVFFVTSFFTVGLASEYNISSMLFATILSVSLVASNTLIPTLSKSVFENNKPKEYKTVAQMYGLGLMTVALGGMTIILFGGLLLDLIGSEISLPNDKVIFAFIVLYMFEMIFQVSTYICATYNNVNYVKSILVSGIMNVCVAYVGLRYFEIRNIEFVLMCQFFTQAIFNYWYWPRKAILYVSSNKCMD